MAKYKVNKQKCTGCRLCIQKCPRATKIGLDGKAAIVDQEKLEQCGGESVCSLGAIEKVGEENKGEELKQQSQASIFGRDMDTGRGMSKGMGRGMGRGLGTGPRDGRGRGRGGGGRRRW